MRGVVVLVAGQGPQQVQLDLLGSGGQGRAWDGTRKCFSGSNDFKLNLCYFSSFQIYWITGVIVGEEILVVILLRPLHAAPDSGIATNFI